MSVTRIQPKRRFSFFEWKEIFEYRDLLYFLSLRDIKLRYKQTSLGVVWVILQPLVPAIIFAVLFGNFARLPSDGQPYLLVVFTGLVPWSLFNNIVGRAGVSLVGNANLMSKIYFPRIIIPLAAISSVVVDCMVGMVVLAVLMAIFGTVIGWHLLFAPLFILSAFMMGLGVTLVVSSLNVYSRDFGYAVPFVLQAWNYLTPVVYSSELIPKRWIFLYSLNPTVGLVEGFRWSILGTQSLNSTMLVSMIVGVGVSLASGMMVFQRIERGFADIV
ncbi:ABC transporter permease [Synechococcus sp. CS-1332]|uniref:ABC transporter permease n=1 Tax=Synechococcus sp. CS-1332 TaxID=2847972 RepID=UPI00223B20C7|nr:ABC transporter permease [Synechococcus sp. CS-1332]MCT0209037.1 ABC transporter permease [Synechococcus sp. CS-1332]